jgi:hypothetical protein
MKSRTRVAAMMIAISALSLAGLAQSPPMTQQAPESGEPGEDLRTRNALSQSELKRLGEMVDQWSRVEGKSGVSPREARKRTAQMLEVLGVSCEIADAVYRGTGPGDAKPHLYEAACVDGMGYLMSLAGESLSGTSCLSGDELATQVKCALPANADRNGIAAAVLRGKSVTCAVRDVRWLGVDAASLDHVEVACEEAAGYVLRYPRPGHRGEHAVIGCEQAGKSGVFCQLTASSSAPGGGPGSRPALSWFNDALTRHGVSCGTRRARIVGRESIKRRYVVEFECEARPEGLIAFVPAEGDTVNAFETLNCVAAASRGIHCQFLPVAQ